MFARLMFECRHHRFGIAMGTSLLVRSVREPRHSRVGKAEYRVQEMQRDPRVLRAAKHPLGGEVDERIDPDGHETELKWE